MQRLLVLAGTVVFCGLLAGCSADPREDAITGIIQLMNLAASQVGSINAEVKEAVKKHEKEKTPLDLTEAGKLALKLENTGEELQKTKVKRVDQVKPADDDEKAALIDRYGGQVKTAFTELVKHQKELNATLNQTEKLSEDARTKVEDLRKKIQKADGPFQALNRGQG